MNRNLEIIINKPPSRLTFNDRADLRFNGQAGHAYRNRWLPAVCKNNNFPILCVTVRKRKQRHTTVSGSCHDRINATLT